MMPRVDVPEAGYYVTKLVRGGPRVGVHIWHDAPPDPETGELLDRSPRWQASINGNPCDIDTVWPYVAGRFIDQAEHDYLVALSRHAKTWDRGAPEAQPTAAADLTRYKPIF